jgi:hypothetical protein
MTNGRGWDDRLTALSNRLAELYPTVDASRRVLATAGLSPSLIKFHEAAAINWFNILDEARKRGRVEDIVRARC